MRANEFIIEELDEAGLRSKLAAAGLAGSLAVAGATAPGTSNFGPFKKPDTMHLKTSQTLTMKQSVPELTQAILDKYDIDPRLAAKVATIAKRHEYSTFPKADDILTVVGIESSFDPQSVSGLTHDPAIGLMQVRPKTWNINPAALTTIDKQIKIGAAILNDYYNKLGSVPDAIHAYNVGLTNFKHKVNLNPEYVQKFADEKKLYSKI